MMYKLSLLAGAAILWAGFAPPSVRAEGTAVGVRAATSGLGLEVTQRAAPRLNVRLGGSLFSYTYETTWELSESDASAPVDFDIDLKLRSASLLVDFLPGDGGFRLTGGVFYNRNEVIGDAVGSGRVTIDDRDYTWDEIGRLEAEAPLGRKLAPYAGMGFGNAVGDPRRKLTLTVDLGVLFQGSPEVTLRAVGGVANVPGLQQDLDAAAQEINEGDLRKFRFYPIVSIGIALRLF